jgi:hypothetical protein
MAYTARKKERNTGKKGGSKGRREGRRNVPQSIPLFQAHGPRKEVLCFLLGDLQKVVPERGFGRVAVIGETAERREESE